MPRRCPLLHTYSLKLQPQKLENNALEGHKNKQAIFGSFQD